MSAELLISADGNRVLFRRTNVAAIPKPPCPLPLRGTIQQPPRVMLVAVNERAAARARGHDLGRGIRAALGAPLGCSAGRPGA
jgi:hypothetical protein